MAPFIRPFKESDSERTAYICRATLPPTLSSSEAATRLAPYIWTHQYTTLCPANCLILDDGSGAAVGYVIGCPDVFAFARDYPRYVSEVLQTGRGKDDVPAPKQLDSLEPWFAPAEGSEEQGGRAQTVNETCLAQLAYNPQWLLLRGVEGKAEMVGTYRGTMHIDLLPEFQGKGWGRQMIDRFFEVVREAVKQSHGQLDVGNGIQIGVAGENKKVVGFYEKCGFRVYPGGESEGNIWMVRDV